MNPKSTNGYGHGNGDDNDQPLPVQPRSPEEIAAAEHMFFEKVWYERHQFLEQKKDVCEPNVHDMACQAAREIEAKYPGELGPYTDFEWGLINGKLSALRWVTGDEWDMLDT
jgi:hypothetical protein